MADAVAERIQENIQPLLTVCDNYTLYQSEIDFLCDEYISTLPDPQQITKSATFPGMLNYIYKSKLRFLIEQDRSTRKGRTNNYSLLDTIFENVYLPVCNKYNIVPTVIGFCVFVHVDMSTVNSIKDGTYRTTGNAATSAAVQTVQKWYSTCEANLYSRAITDNSIGAIFALKAKHGYRDTAEQQITVNVNQVDHAPDQIAEVLKIAETAN